MAPSAFRVDLSRGVPTALETFISPGIRSWRVSFPVDSCASKKLDPRRNDRGGRKDSMMSEVMVSAMWSIEVESKSVGDR